MISFSDLPTRCHVLSILAAVALVIAGPVSADVAETAQADYERLLRWQVSTTPIDVPDQGLVWQRDTAAWMLESGQLWPLPATSDGTVTGFLFVGKGHFQMTLPDPAEVRNWARMTDQPSDGEIELTFDQAVLRTSGNLVHQLITVPESLSFGANKVVEKRAQECLVKRFDDVDARVIAGRLLPDDDYLWIEMETAEFGWLTYTYDDLRREEIQLSKLERNFFTEIWVSLDRREDRLEDGRPSSNRDAMLDVHHADIKIDLTGKKRPGTVGMMGMGIAVAEFDVDLHITSKVDGAQVLPLELSATSEVESITTEDGTELSFLRDHIGSRTIDLDKRVYDSSLMVILDRPLKLDESRRLRFKYKREMPNFLPGRSWYPNLPDNFTNLHTADITIKLEKKHEVRAIGKLIEETVENDVKTSKWRVDTPTKMCSITYGSRFKEEVLEVEGVPKVVSFGPQVSGGFGTKMIRNVGADVVNSLKFFQWLFDDELPNDSIHLTGINSGHGQAFEGFIHVSEFTYHSEHPGASEMFRAHETAHQWWGHQIGWHSYRDQWLSESFAEYSAMMFIEATMKNGKQHFDEALQMYTNLLLGSQKGRFSKYARPYLNDADLSHRRRMGPIGLGYRASNALMPQGYTIQAYHKGPLVLHMLRSVLRPLARGSDQIFLNVLRDFVETNRGKNATTEDFLTSLNKFAPGDWRFFIDQWIHGTEIPTYEWSYSVPKKPDAQGNYVVDLEISQKDVPEGWVMPLPVAFTLPGDRTGTYMAEVTGPENSFQIPLPARPTKLELAPDFAVLARIKKR